MQWLKLHLSLARSPALLTVSLAARGAFFQLFLAANDEGQIAVPRGATHEDVARALLHDPSDETAPTRTLHELTTRGLVVETDDALVVPSRLGIDREGRAVGGVGSRGGRSAAERKRDSRAKRVTKQRDANRDMSRDAVTIGHEMSRDNRDINRDIPPSSPQVSPLSLTLSSLPSPLSPSLSAAETANASVTGSVTERDMSRNNVTPIVTRSRNDRDIVTGQVTLSDGSDIFAALAAIEQGSGGRFSGRASGEQHHRLLTLLVEQKATIAECRALGAVMASPPPGIKISGAWTVTVLLGKPDSSGHRDGGMLRSLLAEVDARRASKSRNDRDMSRDSVTKSHATPRLAKVERPAFLNDPTPPPNATEES